MLANSTDIPPFALCHLELYPYASQNLASSFRGDNSTPSAQEIADLAKGWYNEQENGEWGYGND